MKRHVLVTNDFPPKIGGIQNYLWELWRRLPSDSFAVYTTAYDGAAAFDADQPFRVIRAEESVLTPSPRLVDRINRLATDIDADLVMLDPALPLGVIGPRLDRPYGLVLHGAEITVPGRLPGSGWLLGHILRRASLVIAAGHYPLAEAERCAGRRLPAAVVPPGVDTSRFRPLGRAERRAARAELGLGEHELVVASVNRLVPRKGMDVLIRSAAYLRDRGVAIQVLIGGTGRQHDKLAALIRSTGAPARLLGRLSTEELVRLYGAADVMAMLCHDRWFGLEQEGFGIVFLEAAAVGIPQVAGRSGGAHEAVAHGVTGLVVDKPRHVPTVARALQSLGADPVLRARMGAAARERVCAELDYDHLAAGLQEALSRALEEADVADLRPLLRPPGAAVTTAEPASTSEQGSDNLNAGA